MSKKRQYLFLMKFFETEVKEKAENNVDQTLELQKHIITLFKMLKLEVTQLQD